MTTTQTTTLPLPGTCSCGSIFGCDPHGPQPRERQVPCLKCGRLTFAVDDVCERHIQEEVK